MATSTRKGYRRCTKCGVARAERFYKPRGKVCSNCQKRRTRSAGKDTRLQTTYGITLEEWDQMLLSQGGGCAICGGTRPSYDTDHDHAIEKLLLKQGHSVLMAARMSVRGLLCRRCNRRLLPGCTDSTDVLKKAIKYLDTPPAHRTLKGPP